MVVNFSQDEPIVLHTLGKKYDQQKCNNLCVTVKIQLVNKIINAVR